MESPAFDVDTSDFPLVVVCISGRASDAEFENYLSALDDLYARRERFALIVDATLSHGATAAQRRRQAEWIQEKAERIRTFNVGTAFVIDSALVRGALTAILWLSPIPSPHQVCENRSQALRWARDRLRGCP